MHTALAEQLSSTAKACRRCGMGWVSFYEWERQFHLEGPVGLTNLPFHQPRKLGRTHKIQNSERLLEGSN